MNMYRETYAEINLKNIKENVSKIIKKYNNYEYYFGVVKAECYGHQGLEPVKAVIKGGCNYLAVATLEEALYIRKTLKQIPILCLGIIPVQYANICAKNNITITISSLLYAEELIKEKTDKLKIHIKINSGMNRLGINNKEEFNKTFEVLKANNIFIEGIYTHIYDSNNSRKTEMQFNKYKEIINDINKEEIPILHIAASDTITNYPKLDFVNGCRLGIIMYGFTEHHNLNLKSTFSLYSKVIQINNLRKGDTVGYGGIYKAKGDEQIAVVCIGYADGIIRKNSGRNVYINGISYPIVGNICMDMMFVKIDDKVKLNDTVVVLKDIKHIEDVAKHLNSIPYEVICSVSTRVPRIYINK